VALSQDVYTLSPLTEPAILAEHSVLRFRSLHSHETRVSSTNRKSLWTGRGADLRREHSPLPDRFAMNLTSPN
jgi:hypothetical protein